MINIGKVILGKQQIRGVCSNTNDITPPVDVKDEVLQAGGSSPSCRLWFAFHSLVQLLIMVSRCMCFCRKVYKQDIIAFRALHGVGQMPESVGAYMLLCSFRLRNKEVQHIVSNPAGYTAGCLKNILYDR